MSCGLVWMGTGIGAFPDSLRDDIHRYRQHGDLDSRLERDPQHVKTQAVSKCQCGKFCSVEYSDNAALV